ncbi:MAG: serine--tRNA ligase [Nitrospirae bacterium]|nr:serine--tRNA ligase [Nitrospirota bacterium]
MLDIRLIRETPELVQAALRRRGGSVRLDELLAADTERRRVTAEAEGIKARQNEASKEIARIKRADGDASALLAEMKDIADRAKALTERARELEEAVQQVLLTLPNMPQDDVPDGAGEADNVELRRVGAPTLLGFPARSHDVLGEGLGLMDFARAAKIAGARFASYRGPLARMERALTALMLDLHTGAHGFTEVVAPYLVNASAMLGTGQLPKFAEDLFTIPADGLYLIPTAEVSLTNLYGGEILAEADLPLKMTAFSPCFRREAGSYGKDTKGLIRQHQFHKVEMVMLVHPEKSAEALEFITACAEKVLQRLELPYRVITLCTGDLGFGAQKTYDIEVWLPAQDTYREISSCSNFGDFQARRAGIRFKGPGGKPRLVHTLNGSGLAVGRTLVAVMENYQREDGTIRVPDALRPYMGGLEVIAPAG